MDESNTASDSGKKGTITFTRSGRSWSIFLICTSVFLLVTTAIFLGLFVHYYTRYVDSKKMCNTPDCVQPESKKICTTPDCILAAAMMTKNMNMTADPCVDFHEYACGGFNAGMDIPENRNEVSAFSILGDTVKQILKKIITQDIRPEDPRYLLKMKTLYKSCMDEDKIEQIGLLPYLEEKVFINDWPTLNANWTSSTFDLNATIALYETVFVQPLFQYDIIQDAMNSSQMVLYLSQPNQIISQEYYNRQRNDSVIMAYQTYLAETAVALGANRSTAEQDAKDVVDLQVELAKIMVADDRNLTKQYNPVTLGQLSYPGINIAGAIRTAFAVVNITLPDDEKIINTYPAYFGNLSLIINNFTTRVLQNLFGFKYAVSKVGSLTKRMREIDLDFAKVYYGQKEAAPRWQTCFNKASESFSIGMGKQFVTRSFSEQSKRYMEKMVGNLKTVFKEMLDESTWIGQQTKEAAYKKLATMRVKIGYPDVDFTEKDIDMKYENFTMFEDRYYENINLCRKLTNLQVLSSLRKPVDRNKFEKPTYEVNAYYIPINNEIVFPAAILQSPFFSQNNQDSMNYGGIGLAIGHEIAHGFDDQGSQFDDKGNLRNWWNESDRDVFNQRSQCLVEQYSNFRLDEVNMNVSGINSLGEAIGDNAGIKDSYRAYKKHVQTNGELPALPGLKLTQDQLFFLSFGQVWCSKKTREALIIQLTSHPHPPQKYRIIGTLQNSEDFAKAYNCARGSYMNPEKKCSVW